MVAIPPETPVTVPVEPIAAIPELLLVHVPPTIPSASVVVSPTQTVAVPVIGFGNGLTVAVIITKHPVDKEVYDIIGLPPEIPATTPVLEPTVACNVLLLLQKPPVVISVNVTVDPTHTTGVPPIGAGFGFTVTGVDT